jgi:hypothetical protein
MGTMSAVLSLLLLSGAWAAPKWLDPPVAPYPGAAYSKSDTVALFKRLESGNAWVYRSSASYEEAAAHYKSELKSRAKSLADAWGRLDAELEGVWLSVEKLDRELRISIRTGPLKKSPEAEKAKGLLESLPGMAPRKGEGVPAPPEEPLEAPPLPGQDEGEGASGPSQGQGPGKS